MQSFKKLLCRFGFSFIHQNSENTVRGCWFVCIFSLLFKIESRTNGPVCIRVLGCKTSFWSVFFSENAIPRLLVWACRVTVGGWKNTVRPAAAESIRQRSYKRSPRLRLRQTRGTSRTTAAQYLLHSASSRTLGLYTPVRFSRPSKKSTHIADQM